MATGPSFADFSMLDSDLGQFGAAWRQPALFAGANQACSLGPSGDDRERGKRSGIPGGRTLTACGAQGSAPLY